MSIIEANNCCVCCGKIIPEGFQVCSECNSGVTTPLTKKQINKEKTNCINKKRRKSIWEFLKLI